MAKVIHGNVQATLLYTSIMYWPLTTTAAARLFAPLMVIILSYFFLRESTNLRTVGFLAITLAGACLIIFNTPENLEEAARIATLGSASFIAYIILIGEPICMSIGQVLLRKLRELGN